MILILSLLVIIIIPGSVIYMYLRQEQDKFIPKDRYELLLNNSESPKRFFRPNKNTLLIIAGLIFGVAGVKLFMSGLTILADPKNGRTAGGDTFSGLGFVVGTTIMGAGLCILIGILIMAFLYKDQIIVLIFTTIKTVLNKIHRLYNHKVVTKNE